MRRAICCRHCKACLRRSPSASDKQPSCRRVPCSQIIFPRSGLRVSSAIFSGCRCRAHDNDLAAPMARYFVIHDTSGPNFGHRSFPNDIDGGGKLNDLRNFECHDGWGKAHVVISRTGELLVAHDYSIPWREPKFEQAAEFGGALKGLFLHNEMIQPRRSAPDRGRRNDARSPDPAFTPEQYDRLALLYVIASVRAERWLIPGFPCRD